MNRTHPSDDQLNISASPTKTTPFQLGGLDGFLPLSADSGSAVSTRGQRLPGVIRNRSNASLYALHSQQSHRGPVTLRRLHDEEDSDTGSMRTSTREASDGRKMSVGAEVLLTPQMRSMRLIGNSNPRYRWGQYYKTEGELKVMKKPIRQYYERNNFLIAQYLYIDRLLDSSLPHNLIQEYNQPTVDIPRTIAEEPTTPERPGTPRSNGESYKATDAADGNGPRKENKVKRTPKGIYNIPDEDTPLLDDPEDVDIPGMTMGEDDIADSGDRVVTVAIYINLVANFLLLLGKIAVIILTSSLSVLASLVDAALDFLSTGIVWTTTKLIAHQDQYSYPVGRRKLEPVGVLVFSVIMITSFFQVALECFSRLNSGVHVSVELGLPAIIILAGTVIIKFACWLWCRLINNSSVRALAQDAMTDVVFNIFSIIFPLVGFYAKIWWLDALGGLVLSFYVIINWSRTSSEHIRNLTGAAATADERNVLLYLTMRFAKTIKQIQGLQAYHAGDKLNVEVDIVLDESTNLRDSHDLGESLQYVLESVPIVDRAFVHQDYSGWNLPSHLDQQRT